MLHYELKRLYLELTERKANVSAKAANFKIAKTWLTYWLITW